jgi:hypothetical protein
MRWRSLSTRNRLAFNRELRIAVQSTVNVERALAFNRGGLDGFGRATERQC